MTKPKPKKSCEFEAMRQIAEILALFANEERNRITSAVANKLEAQPFPPKRGRKPKSNGAHTELAG